MATVFVDASCMIAAVCAWHEHHAQAVAGLEHRMRSGDRLATAGHALTEAYAVMTRLPAPFRLSPADALALIEANFMANARVFALDARSYRALLRRVVAAGIAGGRTYDAVIAECARKAKSEVLFTFNPRHFAELEAEGVRVVVPGP